jgi:predicted dehydrogenase
VPRARSVLVIGQGSIGSRHGDVLRDLGLTVATVSRRSGHGQFASISDAIGAAAFDAVAVATETSRHAAELAELHRLGYAGLVLVEKPVCAQSDELEILPATDQVFVGYNLRFHPVVRALRDALTQDHSPIVAAQFCVGQSLRSWRPGRDQATVYSAFRKTGGGILRDLSHELDLATWLFGMLEQVSAIGGRYGAQTVDSDDAWSILASSASCPQISIAMNGIDQVARRSIAVTSLDQTYQADLIGGILSIGASSTAVATDRDESYRRMWQALLGDDAARADLCTLRQGADIVRLIGAIEQASERRCWVRPELKRAAP